jgi:uncharacterized protein DUF1194
MVQPCRVWWLVLTAAALLIGSPSFAHEATEVDLALVLAVDVSSSMDSDEQDLQRQGYVNALRSAMVLGAIRSGRTGRIAVIYVDWSDAFDQRIVVPWTVIGDHEQATIFARALEEKATRMARGATSISGAIDFGRRLLMTAPFVAARKVIDISGDGKNNHGASVAQARSATLFQDITINGLPLVFKNRDRPPDLWNDVEHYYRDCVIGGVGAFMVPVYRTAQFADAIRDKLVREIASPAPDPAFAGANSEPRVDCREGAGKGPMR